MSESPEVCQFSSTETTFQHCYNISVSNPVQRFLKGLSTFAFTKNICLYSQRNIQNIQPCIPDWLPKGKVQVSDCNFDPAPPEILATIYNQKNAIFEAFIKPSAGFTQDLQNVQPSLD